MALTHGYSYNNFLKNSNTAAADDHSCSEDTLMPFGTLNTTTAASAEAALRPSSGEHSGREPQ